jgi:putative oxidoreductase
MIPERYAPQVYALFRFVAGFLFLFHGLQKLFGMFGREAVAVGTLPWLAGMIETVGGVLLMIGFLVRPVAFIASGEMAAAYFMAHQPRGTWPIQNGGELAALYCFAFLYFAARGAGIWSIDSIRKPRR